MVTITSLVTLNLFQGLWRTVADCIVAMAGIGPWMLKQVQHDEILMGLTE